MISQNLHEYPKKMSELPKILFILKSTTMKFDGYNLKDIPTSTGRADVVARFIQAVVCSPEGGNQEGRNQDMGAWILLNDHILAELSAHFTKNSIRFQPFSCLITASSFSRVFSKSNINSEPKPDLKSDINSEPKSDLRSDIKSHSLISEIQILKNLYSSLELNTTCEYDCANTCNTCLYEPMGISDFETLLRYLHDKGYSRFILQENAEIDLMKQKELLPSSQKIAFIIGDQLGFLPADLEIVEKLNSESGKITPISVGKKSQLASSVVSLIKWILLNSH